MVIDPLPDHLFQGQYFSHHPRDNEPSSSCPTLLAGSADQQSRSLGWFITTSDAQGDPVTTTTWSGHYQCRHGREIITATWYRLTDTVTPT